jgi:hypothetical protein
MRQIRDAVTRHHRQTRQKLLSFAPNIKAGMILRYGQPLQVLSLAEPGVAHKTWVRRIGSMLGFKA